MDVRSFRLVTLGPCSAGAARIRMGEDVVDGRPARIAPGTDLDAVSEIDIEHRGAWWVARWTCGGRASTCSGRAIVGGAHLRGGQAWAAREGRRTVWPPTQASSSRGSSRPGCSWWGTRHSAQHPRRSGELLEPGVFSVDADGAVRPTRGHSGLRSSR